MVKVILEYAASFVVEDLCTSGSKIERHNCLAPYSRDCKAAALPAKYRLRNADCCTLIACPCFRQAAKTPSGSSRWGKGRQKLQSEIQLLPATVRSLPGMKW